MSVNKVIYYVLAAASYPDVSLDVRAKEGGKETTGETCFACRLYPSHGPLRCISSHSFRARLCHAKNEAPEEEAVLAVRHVVSTAEPLFKGRLRERDRVP